MPEHSHQPRSSTETEPQGYQVLWQLAKTLTLNASQPQAGMQLLVELSARALRVARVSFWRFDRSYGCLVCQAVHQLPPVSPLFVAGARLFLPNESIYLRSFAQRRVVLIDANNTVDNDFLELAQHYLQPLGITASLDAPVWGDGQVEAVLCIEHIGSERCWSEEEIGLAAAFADQAALLLSRDRRQRAEQALQEHQYRLQALYDQAPMLFFLVDAQGVILSINAFGATQLGYGQSAALTGIAFSELCAAEDKNLVQLQLDLCVAQPQVVQHLELRMQHRNGDVLWVRTSARLIYDPHLGNTISLIAEDISESHRLAEQLRYQAIHDDLTGLFSRREFERRLESLLEWAGEGNNHAVCYLDLDQFKVVNDTCGHIAGDELLRQLGALLQQQLQSSNVLLARLGGDEFGVLVLRCSAEQARSIAECMREAIAGFRFTWQGHVFRVGVSIGVVPLDGQLRNLSEVLSLADAACYAAKDKGRNRIHLYHADDRELARRQGEMQWISRVVQALEQNTLELSLQPIVPVLDTSAGGHFEVLLRMRDAQGEIILPGAFMPAAERYHLTQRVDRWVIAQLLEWLEHEPQAVAIKVCAINLSGHSLTDESFLDYVLTLLQHSHVDAQRLCFEITETAAIANLTAARRFIKTLRMQGCRFALDDFGSGLSSFAYLRNLPVDYVKIDGQFIRDIDQDPVHLAMVRSINEIAHIMGKQTVAEFVENPSILHKLREIGVDFAQGSAISEPCLLRDVKQWPLSAYLEQRRQPWHLPL